MKRAFSRLFLVMVLSCGPADFIPAMAQAPPPPPNSGTKGDNTNKGPGGDARLYGSAGAVLMMAAGYGLYRWIRKKRSGNA